jgi:hypothetical protein
MKTSILFACMMVWLMLECQGQSRRLFPTKSMDAWGYVDARGMAVIPPRFDSAGVFYGNRAVVKLGDKYGFIDCGGKMVIAPRWEQLKYEFQTGFAILNTDGYNEVVDSNGVVVFRSQGEIYMEADGICQYQIKKKLWGLFDCKSRKALGEVKCSSILGFFEGLSAFTYKGRDGFINQNGDIVIPAVYQGARSFHEGKAAVLTDREGWKYIDATGKPVGEGRYVQATDYREGYAAVQPENSEKFYSDTAVVQTDPGEMVMTVVEYYATPWSLIDSNGTLVQGLGDGMVNPPVHGVVVACDDGQCQAISIHTGLRVIPVVYPGSIMTTDAYLVCHDALLHKVDVYDYSGMLISSIEGVLGVDVTYWGVIRVSSDCEYGDLVYGVRPCSFQYFTGETWVP